MAQFLKSAVDIKQDCFNDDVVEFCFIGRSNAGKSSLINALANARVAKTSKTPGRTQLINFFDFKDYRLIDLPGYGYANVGKQTKQDINELVNHVLTHRVNLFGVFQICDMGIITKQDIEVAKNVSKKFNNHFIVLNKMDKLNKSYFFNNKAKIAKMFNKSEDKLIPVSADKKINMAYLKQIMNDLNRKVK